MFKLLGQAVIIVLVFFAVSAYQERNMLADSGEQTAPPFHLPILQSKQTYSSIQLKGQQSVVYFFAPWCGVCRVSMPNIDKLHQQGKVKAVAIALDYRSTEEVTKFVSDLQLDMPVLLGNQTTAQAYKVQAYPTYYVLDENFKITERSVGYSSEIGIRARL
ncbi:MULTISPECIES: TlpA disulfide reductase family protein [unclassified Pseudoalteromonas]|uniref:TlpA family protein disulfide reductase n=1 Tax=unclassified Pseudoalteromonas TaxID=194690 RepID=UPI001BA4430C|nr:MULTISPECIES: TlpA disulfide reductase family protein [unclassified Pseudoalteromonas]MCF2825365.1 TlpA family protein disulfide reductase [Pseudoalteromonas sp. OF5H-5]MCF2833479.1 TlpA family protein disulfide reductase [Pseudoalteromonas sp. DL2-H6]MCF2923256.1 TlpA family protein disulfide reductase [Pseudoalteromonas sp. DL2-H1]MCG7555435.1 TlpA family protein disulfide reductase [Pseudoalteromonas sp. Of11M-6]QUI71651.1 redoxin family protein [Pseudoalteromonas sp. M8]